MAPSTSINDQTKKNRQIGQNIAEIFAILTQPLIGEVCHQVRFSFGDELRLDFGEMVPYKHHKLKNLLKGSWRFGTRATPWLLKAADQLLLDSQALETEREIEKAKQLTRQSLENKKILKIEVNPVNLELRLFFEAGYELILHPDLNDDSGLAYWELFMPTEQILEIGPGYFWSCKSIHDKSY